jgi:hypothetical protein
MTFKEETMKIWRRQRMDIYKMSHTELSERIAEFMQLIQDDSFWREYKAQELTVEDADKLLKIAVFLRLMVFNPIVKYRINKSIKVIGEWLREHEDAQRSISL